MAFSSQIINPADNSRDNEGRSQGVWTSSTAMGYDGQLYKWTGAMWELQGGGGGSSGTTSYPKFDFDWTKARSDALTQLTPYYEQKLKEAGGDVERAKRLIEEDYMKGVRYSSEDYTKTEAEAKQDNLVNEKYRLKSLKTEEERAGTLTTEKQLVYDTAIRQADEDLATNLKILGLDITEENRNLQGSLNQRNVLLGTIPQGDTSSAAPMGEYAKSWFINPQTERQDLRKLAIERALSRQKEVAGMTKQSALGDIGYGLKKTQTASSKTGELSEIEKQRAITNALLKKTRDTEKVGVLRTRGIEEQDIEYPRSQRDIEEEKRRRAFETVAPMTYSESYARWRAINNLG